jgi:hypothetical protein
MNPQHARHFKKVSRALAHSRELVVSQAMRRPLLIELRN